MRTHVYTAVRMRTQLCACAHMCTQLCACVHRCTDARRCAQDGGGRRELEEVPHLAGRQQPGGLAVPGRRRDPSLCCTAPLPCFLVGCFNSEGEGCQQNNGTLRDGSPCRTARI